MKIALLEDKILGGRQKYFAYLAREMSDLGHKVDIYLKENPNALGMPLSLLGLDFKYSELKEWNQVPDHYQVIILPYPQVASTFQSYHTFLITHLIRPDIQFLETYTVQVWVNCQSVKKEISHDNVKVIYPPLDYDLFKKEAKPFGERDLDVINVGSLIVRKGIQEYDTWALKSGLKTLGIYLRDWKYAPIKMKSPLKINLSQQEVAKLMGRAKIAISFSHAESLPLTLLEALASGCSCYYRDVGYIRQELGVETFEESPSEDTVRRLLKIDRVEENQQKLGLLNGNSLREVLEEIEEEIG